VLEVLDQFLSGGSNLRYPCFKYTTEGLLFQEILVSRGISCSGCIGIDGGSSGSGGAASGGGIYNGSVEAISFTADSSTEITAVSPAESAGTVDITVTTPRGTSATSTGDQFTYVAPSTKITGDSYTPVNPMRLADTRCNASTQPSFCSRENIPSANSTLTTLGAGKTENVMVTGVDSIPISATAVVGNLTATDGAGDGYLTLYSGTRTPTTSNVNFTIGATDANMVASQLSSSGTVNIANGSGQSVNAVLDVSGWFGPTTS
jgi:hypothetical protein